jgi:DNA primase
MLISPIEEIKSRLNVVDVVGHYIKLQKAGANFRATCPFHSEKKPSFFVSPTRQLWHCFGCGAGGGIFDFVMRIEGVEFGDALRILAQKAGVELKKEDPRLKTERKRLYEICELATVFFENQLAKSEVGQEAKQYLFGRGVKEESVEKWRIGYAPDAWSSLLDFLVGRGYGREEIVKAGLAIRKQDESLQSPAGRSYFDRFRGRIMFPICDIQGQVVGFSGRVFKTEDTAKYINTPSTLLYDKSRILYGLDKAKLAIRKLDECILVEGQMDAIMVSQAGYENVVATSGTALTPFQLKILKRYSENLLTAFDMDVAGDTATKRGIDLAQQEGFSVRVVVMPEGRDPADVIAENPSLFGDLISKARSIMDFYFESTFAKFDSSTPDGKIRIAKVLLPVLKRIPNAIELAHWRQKLAHLLRVREEDIEAELKKIPSESSRFQELSSAEFSQLGIPKSQKTRKEILEEFIMALLLKYPAKIHLVQEKYLPLFSRPIRMFLEQMRSNGEDSKILFAAEQSLPANLHYLFLRAESFEEEGTGDPEGEIALALAELWRLERRKKLEEMALAIKEAEAANARERAQSLMQEFHILASELRDS